MTRKTPALIGLIAAALSPLLLAAHPISKPSATVIGGCEGEGCDCTNDKVSNKAFTLYNTASLASRKLGAYPAGTQATHLGAYTRVFDRGLARVTAVSDSALGLKVGDMVTYVFSEGEGYLTAQHKGKTVSFYYEDLTLDDIRRPNYKTWYKASVNGVTGYSPVFPFQGCLE